MNEITNRDMKLNDLRLEMVAETSASFQMRFGTLGRH